ncbi:hypothetical protein EDD15DRAFT_2252921 [Pisolithus albus]|nr:hypothetical protein EDD15DRAFT_2252921 [Pisolithus albus]
MTRINPLHSTRSITPFRPIWSDKLVRVAVLEVILRHVEPRIARKFPGNADGARTEMMEAV